MNYDYDPDLSLVTRVPYAKPEVTPDYAALNMADLPSWYRTFKGGRLQTTVHERLMKLNAWIACNSGRPEGTLDDLIWLTGALIQGAPIDCLSCGQLIDREGHSESCILKEQFREVFSESSEELQLIAQKEELEHLLDAMKKKLASKRAPKW